jgi:hypothetical protein
MLQSLRRVFTTTYRTIPVDWESVIGAFEIFFFRPPLGPGSVAACPSATPSSRRKPCEHQPRRNPHPAPAANSISMCRLAAETTQGTDAESTAIRTGLNAAGVWRGSDCSITHEGGSPTLSAEAAAYGSQRFMMVAASATSICSV